MFLEKKGKGDTDMTFSGPIRSTEAAANEDKQQLEEAAAVSMDRLSEVHARLRRRARCALPVSPCSLQLALCSSGSAPWVFWIYIFF